LPDQDIGMQQRNSFFTKFTRMEASSGILLVGAALLAILMANSPLAFIYQLLTDTPVEIRIGPLEIAKPLLLWVNDGFMAIFFFLVGLELKREFLEGELANRRKLTLPALGALGGMVVPAGFYILLNYDDPIALQGWAIPAATDIAFALGILALLGSRVPTSLKVFLTSLAIFDDIGAILIIALFYTSKISLTALSTAVLCILFLLFLNRSGSVEKGFYVATGVVMWVALLKSGVHATLTGVVLAMFIPMRDPHNPENSPLRDMEHDLHPMVAFLILPVFSFCNAGLNLTDVGVDQLLHNVSLGIVIGLFFGKQFGVFAFCWLGVRLGLTDLPQGISWGALYGTAILCGIGFTMSLFIGALAVDATGVNLIFDERLGILIGSLLSGIIGYLVLRRSLLHGH